MKSSSKLLLSLPLIIILSCSRQDIWSVKKDNIVLDPFALSEKTIYLHFSNSTIYDEFNLEDDIRRGFSAKGFNVLNKPENAPILLSLNLKYYGSERDNLYINMPKKMDNEKNNIKAIDLMLFSAGAVGGFLISGNIGVSLISSVAAVGLGRLADYYGTTNAERNVAILDVYIFEYSQNPIQVHDFREVKFGEGGIRKTEFSEKTHFKNYQTQIFIFTNKHSSKAGEIAEVRRHLLPLIIGIL